MQDKISKEYDKLLKENYKYLKPWLLSTKKIE